MRMQVRCQPNRFHAWLIGVLLLGLALWPLKLWGQSSDSAAELPELDQNRPAGLQIAYFALG